MDSTLALQRLDNTPSQAKLSDLHKKYLTQDKEIANSTMQTLVSSTPAFENEYMYQSCSSLMMEGEQSSSGVEVHQTNTFDQYKYLVDGDSNALNDLPTEENQIHNCFRGYETNEWVIVLFSVVNV